MVTHIIDIIFACLFIFPFFYTLSQINSTIVSDPRLAPTDASRVQGSLFTGQAEPVELRAFELSLQKPSHPRAAATATAVAGGPSGSD